MSVGISVLSAVVTDEIGDGLGEVFTALCGIFWRACGDFTDSTDYEEGDEGQDKQGPRMREYEQEDSIVHVYLHVRCHRLPR